MNQGRSLLSALAEVKEKKETFVILQDGKPIADLIPHRRKCRRSHHPTMSAIGIHYDPEAISRDKWIKQEQ